MIRTLMIKQKLKMKPYYKLSKFTSWLGISLAVVLLVAVPLVRADRFDDQINSLNQDTSQKQQTANQLQLQANSYADQIYNLQTQINSLQADINANQAKSADLQNQITQAETDLAKQKKVLGENIKTMYLEGQISTIEMLASSKDLSDFVDKQEYRNSVQNKIKDTLDKITALKQQLKSQKEQLEGLIRDQQSQQAQLDTQRGEQDRLLSLTQDQQAAVTQSIQANNAQVASLRAQQAEENRKRLAGRLESGDPNHGGYPGKWDHAVQDSMLDDWGMLNRECVSYTAWKVFQNFGSMPYWGGEGNANQWPGDARNAGIPTGSTPKRHSVAISMGGAYGHAMWVEDVYDGNQIHVSQYNYDLQGHYSEMTINGSGLIYIYFGQ